MGEEKLREYEFLDSNRILASYDKMNIVGVCEGLKQVTELEVIEPKEAIEAAEQLVEITLDVLGLVYYKEDRSEHFAPDSVCTQYYVAKTSEALDKMREANKKFTSVDYQEEADLERGRLFGFPETAIEYFISNQDSGIEENPCDNNPKYHSYKHSPEHAEEEYEQYEKKIEELFRKYCPKSAKEFLK